MAVGRRPNNKITNNLSLGSNSTQKTIGQESKDAPIDSTVQPLDKDALIRNSLDSVELKNQNLLSTEELETTKINKLLPNERIDLYDFNSYTRTKVSSEVLEEYVNKKADIANFAAGGQTPWTGASVSKILTVTQEISDKFSDLVGVDIPVDDFYSLYYDNNINEIVSTKNSNFFYDYIASEKFNTIVSERAKTTINSVPSRKYWKTFGEAFTSSYEDRDNFNSMIYGHREMSDSEEGRTQHSTGTWKYDPTNCHILNVYGGENFAVVLYHGNNAFQTTTDSMPFRKNYEGFNQSAHLFNSNPATDPQYFTAATQKTATTTKKARAALSIDMSLYPDNVTSTTDKVNLWKRLMDLDNTLRSTVMNPVDVAVGSTHVLFKYSVFSGAGSTGYNLRVFGVPDYNEQGQVIVGGKFGQLQIPSGIGQTAKIAAGGKTNCVIKQSNNRIFAWGDNTQNQCTEANASTVAYSKIAVGADVIMAIRNDNKKLEIFGDKKQYYYAIIGNYTDLEFEDVKICGNSVVFLLDTPPGTLPHIIFGKVVNNIVYSTIPQEYSTDYSYVFLPSLLRGINPGYTEGRDIEQIQEINVNNIPHHLNLIQDIRFDSIVQISCGENHYAFKNHRGEYYVFDTLSNLYTSHTRMQLGNNVIETPQVIYGHTEFDTEIFGLADITIKRRIFGSSQTINATTAYPDLIKDQKKFDAGRNFVAILNSSLVPNTRTGEVEHNIIFKGQDGLSQCSSEVDDLGHRNGQSTTFKMLSCHGLTTFAVDKNESSLDQIHVLGYRLYDNSLAPVSAGYLQVPQAWPLTECSLCSTGSYAPFWEPFDVDSIYSISTSKDSQFSEVVPTIDLLLEYDIGCHTAISEKGKVFPWGYAIRTGENSSDSIMQDYEKSTWAATPFSSGYVRIFGKQLESNISDSNFIESIKGSNQFYFFNWKTNRRADNSVLNNTNVNNQRYVNYHPPLEKFQKIAFTGYGYYILDLNGIVRWYPNKTSDLNDFAEDPYNNFNVPTSHVYGTPFKDAVNGNAQWGLEAGKEHVAVFNDPGEVQIWGRNTSDQMNINYYHKQFGNCNAISCGDYCTMTFTEWGVEYTREDALFITGSVTNNLYQISYDSDGSYKDCLDLTGSIFECGQIVNINCCETFNGLVSQYKLDTKGDFPYIFYSYGNPYSSEISSLDSTDGTDDPIIYENTLQSFIPPINNINPIPI